MEEDKLENILLIENWLKQNYFTTYASDNYFTYNKITEQEKNENPEWFLKKDFCIHHYKNVINLNSPELDIYFSIVFIFNYLDGSIAEKQLFLDKETSLESFIQMFTDTKNYLTIEEASKIAKTKYKLK